MIMSRRTIEVADEPSLPVDPTQDETHRLDWVLFRKVAGRLDGVEGPGVGGRAWDVARYE